MKAYKYKSKIIVLEGTQAVEKTYAGRGEYYIRIEFGGRSEYFKGLESEEEADTLLQNIYEYMTADPEPRIGGSFFVHNLLTICS